MNQTNENTLPTLPLNKPKLLLPLEKKTPENVSKEESMSTTDSGCSAVPRAESNEDLQVKAKSRKCAKYESEMVPEHKNCSGENGTIETIPKRDAVKVNEDCKWTENFNESERVPEHKDCSGENGTDAEEPLIETIPKRDTVKVNEDCKWTENFNESKRVPEHKDCSGENGTNAVEPLIGIIPKRDAVKVNEDCKWAENLQRRHIEGPHTRENQYSSEFALHLRERRTSPFVSTNLDRVAQPNDPPTTIDTEGKIPEEDNSCLPTDNETLRTISTDTREKSDTKVTYKDKKTMKKYCFRSHNKINDNDHFRISRKKLKGYTKRLKKYRNSSRKPISFLGKKIAGLIFHKWPDKDKKLIKHIRKSSGHMESLEEIKYEKIHKSCLKKCSLLFSGKTSDAVFHKWLEKSC